jgi:hypothetical protein
MQRVRHQHQPGHQPSLRGTKHRSLPPAIRMPAQKHLPRAHSRRACHKPTHGLNRVLEPSPIPCRVPRPRRPTRAHLPVREIAAQHHHPSRGHRLRDHDQQWRVGIRSCTMREHQPIASSRCRPVQEPANRWLARNCEPFMSTIRGSHGLESTTARARRTTWGRPPSAVYAERSSAVDSRQNRSRFAVDSSGSLPQQAAEVLALSHAEFSHGALVWLDTSDLRALGCGPTS